MSWSQIMERDRERLITFVVLANAGHDGFTEKVQLILMCEIDIFINFKIIEL